jgi:hypothetical protein
MDENEARDCKVCVRMWHMSKSQRRSSEIRQKSTTLKYSWVKMGKHLYGLVGLPHTSCGYNSIWVIMDRLTKLAYFIPVATTYRIRQYVELYLLHIVRYHGIPKTIISDRWSIFVARFWEQLHECLGTHFIWILAYHPQTDEQTEWVNQIIEDILCACVLTDGRKWYKHLLLAEFSYKNSY